MSTFDNILIFAKYKKIKMIDLTKTILVSNSYFAKQRAGKKKISSDILERIVIAFPDLDANWLLTGTGNMTKRAINPEFIPRNESINSLAQKIEETNKRIDELTAIVKKNNSPIKNKKSTPNS